MGSVLPGTIFRAKYYHRIRSYDSGCEGLRNASGRGKFLVVNGLYGRFGVNFATDCRSGGCGFESRRPRLGRSLSFSAAASFSQASCNVEIVGK